MSEMTTKAGPRLSSAQHWAQRVLVLLCVEKVAQHAVVTWALVTNRFGLRESLAVRYEVVAVAGGVIGVLYVVALGGLYAQWGAVPKLLTALALADIVGEFVVQGTLLITVTLSFVVAILVMTTTRVRYRAPRAAS